MNRINPIHQTNLSNQLRVAVVIMECNPFHKGHQYILDEARARTGADAVIVILSGDYVQRGIPAIQDKETRTRHVLEAGADLVLELPLPYAVGSANYFAQGAVAMLCRLGVVTDLVFGSESSDLAALQEAATFLDKETPEFKARVSSLLSGGLSYPAARAVAAREVYRISLPMNGNDILGIEYVRALNEFDSEHRIKVHAVPRIDTESATTLRTRMLEARAQERTAENAAYMCANAFSGALYYRLTALLGLGGCSDCAAALSGFQDVDHDLAFRIARLLPEYESWEQFCMLVKTRNVTYSRVSRALLHILLDIRAEDIHSLRANGLIGYARILGLRRSAGSLLSAIRDPHAAETAHGSDYICRIPLITSPRSGVRDENIPEVFRRQLQRDLAASELYDYTMRQYSGISADNNRHGNRNSRVCEYSKPMIICSD